MPQNATSSGENSVSQNRKFFFDEVTKRKIDLHLSDINDTISDDDIRNVITDIRSGDAESDSSPYRASVTGRAVQ